MKFRKIELKSGTKLILGKDKESNDALMKKYKGKSNLIIHTVAPGSPFCVIDKKVFDGDIYAAGVLCASYSQDWRDNKKDVRVSVFTGKDISKPKGSKPGLWSIKAGKSKTITIKKKEILKVKK